MATPTLATAAPSAHAGTFFQAPAGGFEDLMVPSSMGPIKVRCGEHLARRQRGALPARRSARSDDRNAWSFETNALQQFGNDNITLVMPVGGQSSFYTDWYAPSTGTA